ncbi:MAG: M20 family metallopeptidase [Pikeienuella sp.]
MQQEAHGISPFAPAPEAPLRRALNIVREEVERALPEFDRMLATDTSFPPGAGYGAFADLMEALFAPLGFGFRRILTPEPLWRAAGGPAEGARVNLIAAPPAAAPRRCGLYFHTDTVPPAPGWTRDPFRLTREGDALHGLGAADMKGAILATLAALRAAAATALPLAYDPVLLFCADEEGGLYPGVRHLAEQGELPAHLINFNGGPAPRIWAGCFGSFSLLARLEGRAGHSASGAGVNAIEAAAPILAAIAALKERVAARASALPPPPGSGPLRPSLSLAAAHGGTCGGQIPARFDLVIARRYAPEEDFDAARAEIETAIRANTPEGVGVTIDLIGHLCPTADADGPHWPRWRAAMGRGFGYAEADFVRYGSASASDFGWVQRATGRNEAILAGLSGAGRNGHAPEEHTTIADVAALARALLAYLARDFAPGLMPADA